MLYHHEERKLFQAPIAKVWRNDWRYAPSYRIPGTHRQTTDYALLMDIYTD